MKPMFVFFAWALVVWLSFRFVLLLVRRLVLLDGEHLQRRWETMLLYSSSTLTLKSTTTAPYPSC